VAVVAVVLLEGFLAFDNLWGQLIGMGEDFHLPMRIPGQE